MDILELIKSRRSIRKYAGLPVDASLVEKILEAGRWAPSGLNNQPWRFAVITEPALRDRISVMTRYSQIVKNAPVLIAVFLNAADSYHRVKDIQGIGACMQNMLLEAHSLGLGAVWLGEIIKADKEIKEVLGLSSDLELMAVIAIGHPDEKPRQTKRKAIDQLLVFKR